MKLLYFVLFILFFISCDEKVILELSNDFHSQLILSSFIDVNSDTIRVKIAKTIPAYGNSIQNLDIEFVHFENITSNRTIVLQKEKDDIWFGVFPQIKPDDVCQYLVKEENRNTLYLAKDTIPEKLDILDVNYSYFINGEKKPAVSINLKFEGKNVSQFAYYELLLYRSSSVDSFYIDDIQRQQAVLTSEDFLITSEDYYPNLLFLFVTDKRPKSLLFKTKSEMIDLNFSYDPPISYSYYGYKAREHKIKAEVRRVSYVYYKYKTTLYKQQADATGDILFGLPSMANVFSNVENGFGVFGCYNSCDTIIDIQGYSFE